MRGKNCNYHDNVVGHIKSRLETDEVKKFLTLDRLWSDPGRYRNPSEEGASVHLTSKALHSTSGESMIRQGHTRGSFPLKCSKW